MANFFPRWTNILPLKIAVCLGALATAVVAGFTYYATPKAQRVGYQPSQPIPYDHDLHVSQLGLDCRYCHSFVEHSGHANVPSSSTCWNCHQHVRRDSPKLEPLRRAMDETYENYDGEPVRWVRVHRAPDFVYFDHSAHVNRGVSCVSCHGQVNNMQVVFHAKDQSMGFCLDCHRQPESHLRPLEEVFNLDYDPEAYLLANPTFIGEGEGRKQIFTQEEFGSLLKEQWNIKPKESCTTCHR